MKKGFLLPIKAFLYGIYMGVFCSFDKKKLGNKITGSDVVYKICENAAKKGQTLMLVGGWKKDKQGKMLPDHGNIANKTADKLQKDLPGIKIVYASSDVTLNEKNDDKFLEEVHKELSEQNVKYVDIVLAAFTSGAQEKWLRRLLPKIPGKVGIGVGASFDYIIGEYKRAPKFMKEMNIEWIHRFIFQPWRAKRIFNSVIEFPLFIYMQSIGK